jgi:Protein of unknown function (DUF1552)
MPFAKKLDRRTVLRGALHGAAVSVALPTLEAMLNGNGTALAKGKPLPRRFGVFFWGNGIRHSFWVPTQRGARWNLSDELEPLAPVKKYINVVTGLNVKTGNEQGHHAGTVGILSGCPMVSQPHPSSAYASTFSAPSIDQVAAEVIGKSTPFRSLEVGVSRQVTENEGTTLLYLSHRGPDAPNPPEYEPVKVFDRLFGDAGRPGTGLGADSALETGRNMGRSVLDVVSEDARALERQLGASDRRRISLHLDGIREIERRVTTEWQRAPLCRPGDRPSDLPVAAVQEPHGPINEGMSRLVALALSCDLTRVFSFMFSGSVGETSFWEVGQDQSHHQFTHDEDGEQPVVHAATVFVMQNFSRLLQVLKETPDGAGNLLDSSVILASSDTADARAHNTVDYPVLIAGRAGGALKYPGIHYRSDSGENTSKALLTTLRAAGLRLPTFGQKGGHVDESLTAIEA